MHRLASFGLVLALGLGWAAAVWGPGDHWAAAVPRDVLSAQSTLREGDPATALAMLDGRDVDVPGLTARLVAGQAALLADETERAGIEFDAAVAIDARSTAAWLGQCLVAGVRGGDGEAACARALERVEDRSECAARMARALMAARVGDGERAEAELAACAAAEPDHDGPAELAPLVGAAGHDAEARGTFVEVVLRGATEGGDPRALAMEEVRELLGTEEPRAAMAALDRAVERWGPGAEVDVLRAQALHQRGDADGARALLVALAPSLRGDSRLALPACVLAADLEAHAEAESLCAARAGATRGDDRCGALHALAQSRGNRGQWSRAEEALSRCLADEPTDGAIWADAAVAAAALGDIDGALDRIRAAEGLEPGSVDPAAFDDERTFAGFKADPRAQDALAGLR